MPWYHLRKLEQINCPDVHAHLKKLPLKKTTSKLTTALFSTLFLLSLLLQIHTTNNTGFDKIKFNLHFFKTNISALNAKHLCYKHIDVIKCYISYPKVQATKSYMRLFSFFFIYVPYNLVIAAMTPRKRDRHL